MTTLRIALVGAGSMATQHAAVVAASRTARAVVVIDGDPDRAASLAGRHGVAVASDLDAALDCDAAIIATSTPDHRDAAMMLLAAGVPVLVEKPLASTLPEVQELTAVAECRDGVLMCGFVERFNPGLDPIFRLDRTAITTVQTVRVGPPPGRVHSSVVDDVLLHDLDLVLRLFGDDRLMELDAHADHWAEGAPWPETVHCRLEFASGATATMHASRVATDRRRWFTATSGSTSCSADLGDAVGNPLAAQFERLVELIRFGTPADRAAERAGINPAHELADRIGSTIGVTSACAS
jgi:predicted dehydrogenase